MAKIEPMVIVQTEYRFVFIPFATYKRVDDIRLLTVFGLPIYKRVGDARSIFGVVFHAA